MLSINSLYFLLYLALPILLSSYCISRSTKSSEKAKDHILFLPIFIPPIPLFSSSLSKSAIYKLKRSGLITQPYLTPFFVQNFSVYPYLVLTFTLVSSYILSTRLEKNHNFNWDEVDILDIEPSYSRRLISEMEYFVASRSMSIIPVAIAMVATFISGSGLLGLSAEIYTYGMQFVVIILSFMLGTAITCYGFLPVFYNLQATSVYEYLEKRFGVRTRMIASFVYWIQQLVHSGLVLYAPSLALETTTGISKTISIVIVGLVCAFYSSIGGIKTVILVDVFQSLLIFIAVLLIIGIAVNNVGGLGQIWEIARQGQRLEFDSIDLDPTVRYTWWSIMLGGLCTFLIIVGVNQVQVQRMLTVNYQSRPLLTNPQQHTGYRIPATALIVRSSTIKEHLFKNSTDMEPVDGNRSNFRGSQTANRPIRIAVVQPIIIRLSEQPTELPLT
ncbi:PREDICTED: putative sodium-dependent multivitamin transporter [Cyphomyrmex costatus]|uniref:putative sodium-dependent multivitamin transporter n=1 Tax=Cyphomyrmex costatus TaxID=456900 RepID=UPI0008521FDB|nr:PREDICTED: putative sodium-dependent multivitamin transporter [Cyphomyrmex costatus]